MRITAAVLEHAHAPFEIKDFTLDDPNANEVIVKIVATGLCHTDLAVRDEHIPIGMPIILGHEGAGIVETVGSSVTHVKPGDHVVLAPASCGTCAFCLDGHPSYCENFMSLNFLGHRLDGSYAYHAGKKQIGGFFFYQSSFATYALAHERNIVKVPKDAPLELLGPLGCGLQTGAGSVINVLRPRAGESIAVFGVGPVGLAAIMAAKASGCTTIIAVDVFDNRLKLAEELGATHSINSKTTVVSEVINSEILHGGVHYSIDTTGRNDVINQAVASLRFMGHCAVVGVIPTPKLEIDTAVFTMGRGLSYVIEGDSVPQVFIPQLISLYKNGLFPFDKLVKFYDLEDINEAVADTEKGVTLKAIVRMPQK
ncbi:aryl-alcohol dehydrogenase [Chitinophaga skermanii]|uniref:Aryl-alcohol dehydrogenase n=1 Tax=Chitinophaga skermanii TaxID=331697 RepID=A0A327PZB5_9BACT|nr:NAD(P)-dependent alcohol dehydrogenase [Chitinophaga skermanii]RAI97585.1 aryl-alcohol dehydrogenase [Chitinophaga skermanii]